MAGGDHDTGDGTAIDYGIGQGGGRYRCRRDNGRDSAVMEHSREVIGKLAGEETRVIANDEAIRRRTILCTPIAINGKVPAIG
jgi:hypothetical protein